MRKKILLVLVAIIVIIQFIRPSRNISNEVSANDITSLYNVPPDVQHVLKVSCNDCHSNNTHYPWYTNIQPIGWWMQFHVDGGKYHLNFSSFGTYDKERQHHKMEEVIEQVKGGHMPLNSYLWMHDEAKLSQQQKDLLITWAQGLMKQIQQTY
ncbi:MAG TPA: heme-binding domain-containing protein [Chitinophagaceae bacterium]|nr:heme-binding domain-containing protein [Chitinophagaceae bacterium]